VKRGCEGGEVLGWPGRSNFATIAKANESVLDRGEEKQGGELRYRKGGAKKEKKKG